MLPQIYIQIVIFFPEQRVHIQFIPAHDFFRLVEEGINRVEGFPIQIFEVSHLTLVSLEFSGFMLIFPVILIYQFLDFHDVFSGFFAIDSFIIFVDDLFRIVSLVPAV